MRFRGRGWTLISLLITVLVAAPALLQAQVTLTTVQDTVYNADGTAAQGTVLVSWSGFTTAGGSSVAAGTTSVTLGTGGTLSVSLAPNAGATPIGSYYTAVFHLDDGTMSRQYWVIPVVAAGGAPVKLAAIENQVLPTSMAMQTVSKSYVDTAIANALTGNATGSGSNPYVLITGSTMTGPLVLPGDPVSALQASDKNYVDTNVAQVSSGLSTKVSTVPTATQTVTQPAGTQLVVNNLNGVLDATGYLSGNGNNGFSNALTSSNCTSGCEVRAGQTYPGTEGVPAQSIPTGGHVTDDRGGSVNEYFVNPLGAGAAGLNGRSMTQNTTMSAPKFQSLFPGSSVNSSVATLTQNAKAGGNNLFPGSHESVPYFKSNFGVLELTGNYNTQGQHVQFGNTVNCYSVGDCMAGGQFITSAGGYRDEADEGTHPFDLQVSEATAVFEGTCGTGCSTGSTQLVINQTAGAGTQGDGRFLMDKNPANVISTGSIVGTFANEFPAATFSGTNFPVSVFLATAQQASSQAGNMAPGTVTLPIETTGVPSGYATTTAALPATSGVACVADVLSTGVIPNFETANYSVVDATHIQLTLNKVHYSGATIAVGGLCGYGIEQTVDTVNGVRQVFPVVGSLSATSLYYAGANSGWLGFSSTNNTGGYLSTSLSITSAVRSGNVVTLTTASSMPFDLNGLSLTVSGVADSSFNGTFAVSTTGSNTLTYSNTGANGSSSGGTVGIVTGGFNLYPMAEVLSVYNPATAAVDGTMTLAPNTVAWAAGDPVEQPHYHQQLVSADMEYITQYVPRPSQTVFAGKQYQGTVGPGLRGWAVINAVPNTNYLGAGGTHRPPDDAYYASGAWQSTFEVDAGEQNLLRVHCGVFGCNRWDSAYALFALDSAAGEDFILYNPSNSTTTINTQGVPYSFSPQAFTAPTVNAGTVSATTVNATTVSASGGASSFTGPNAQYGLAMHLLPYAQGDQTGIDFDNAAGAPSTSYCGGTTYPGQTNRWQFTMNGDASWLVYDNTACRSVIQVAAGGTMALMPGASGNVSVGGSYTSTPPGMFNVGAANQFFVDGSGNVTAALVKSTNTGPGFEETLYTPSSSSAPCTAGQFADDANYHYVCVATNTWKRVALSSF